MKKIVHIGQPCRAKNVLAGRVVVNRTTGHEELVLTDTNEDAGVHLLFIDIEANTGRAYKAPAGSGAWGLLEVPGDRLVVGTYFDGMFMVFDLKKMEFIKAAHFPGEAYIWDLALGNDGRVYGGSYGSGKLGALDLNTYEIEDCGAPAPPNIYLRHVSSLPDGRILCYFFTERPTTMVFDPQTRKFEPVPEHLAEVQSGLSWDGYFITGSIACDGRTLAKVDWPFPASPGDKGEWNLFASISTDKWLFIKQENTIYRYKQGDRELTYMTSVDLRGSNMLGCTKDGSILGVRGQDYFIIKPGTETLDLNTIPVESAPRPTFFLKADPSGKLWGGPHFGQTIFWLDPKTREYANTSKVCDAGGEVYDVDFYKDRIFAVSYVAGDVVRYDPSKPWDQLGNKNPQTIASIHSKGYIRPAAGVVAGPDGKLYSGWWAKYGEYGGAVSITDPDTGETELIEDPLGKQCIAGITTDGRYIYASTTASGNGLPDQKIPTRFGVIDPKTQKAVFEQQFPNTGTVGIHGYDPATKQVVVSAARHLMLFDVEKMSFSDKIADDAPVIDCCSTSVPGNGRLYYSSNKKLLLMDLKTGKVTEIAEAPDKVTNVTTGPDGTIYFSCGVDIYAFKAQ
ncbi:MAG: hypothetical protein ABFD46_11280 [Armatimonadota bacterium]